MDKQNKRESRQTGMTDERIRALEKIRLQKKSGKSQLEQVIEVSIKYFLIYIFFIKKGPKIKRKIRFR